MGALARRADDQIHALVDANGLPIVLKLTEGQAHDGKQRPADMLGGLGEGQTFCSPTGPTTATSYVARLAELEEAWANIKPMPQHV